MVSNLDSNGHERCECGESHYTLCHFCADSLCEYHALALPGHQALDACRDCLDAHAARRASALEVAA